LLNFNGLNNGTACNLVEADQRFRIRIDAHHQGDGDATSTRQHGAVSQQSVVFILAAVRTSNLTYLNANLWSQST